MTTLILFSLAVIGMTNILVDSTLFDPVRSWLDKQITKFAKINEKNKFTKFKEFLCLKVSKVFACYQCMGTWCGFICGIILVSFNPLIILMCGCAGSFLAVFAGHYTNYLEAQTIISLGDSDDSIGDDSNE